MHDVHVSLIEEKYDRLGLMAPSTCLSIYPDPSDMPEDIQKDSKAETEITLADVYEKPEWKDKAEIEYEYDRGDSWCHQLSLLGRATPSTNAEFGAPKDVRVICLGGQGHHAAEDGRGTWGWEWLKDAFKHPRKPENRERTDEYKNVCLNEEKSLDPYPFDVLDVNDELQDAFFDGQSKGKSDDARAGCVKNL